MEIKTVNAKMMKKKIYYENKVSKCKKKLQCGAD